jgi:uncharacterized membrane protein YuzA (DUF378 family)
VAEERTERFTVWSGRISGIIGLVALAVAVLFGVTGVGAPYDPVVYPICGLVGVFLWVMLLRPAAAVEGDRLVLHGALSTVRVPLAAIDQVVVRQFLAVRAGERKFTCTGVSRSRRQGMRDDQMSGDALITDRSFGGFVEGRIEHLAEEARKLQGIEPYSDEQDALAAAVRREWALPEIGLLVLFGLAVVVTLVV